MARAPNTTPMTPGGPIAKGYAEPKNQMPKISRAPANTGSRSLENLVNGENPVSEYAGGSGKLPRSR